MPISYIPSSPNQSEGVDSRGLVQLAMAVHQSNLAEEEHKKGEAASRIKMLTENPDLMSMMDPKAIEKDFKTAGFQLASADQVAAMSKMIQGGGGAPAIPAAPATAPMPGNQLEQLGNTMQGSKAGAQSATPPSKGAAAKAPGGGVTPGGIVTPGTGQLQQLQDQGMKSFTDKVGALGPMYMGAAAQKQQQYMIAKEAQRLDHLREVAGSGGPGAVSAQAELYAAAGQHITGEDMIGMLTNNKDPKVAKEAMDFALHNESGEKRSQRMSDTMKTLGADSAFMGKLKDPTDLPRIVDSIVNGHGVPSDVLKRPMSLDEIRDTNKYQNELVAQGLDLVTAQKAAEARAMGVPYPLSLPSAMHGLTIPQQEAAAKTTAAEGMLMRGEGAIMEGKAALERNELEHQKITKSLDEQLKLKLENMIALQKNGVKIPQEMIDENLSKVAEQSGVSIERVSHWYNWLYLGSQLDAKGNVSKGALEGQEPGASSSTPSPRLSHGTRGVTPAEAARIRSMKANR